MTIKTLINPAQLKADVSFSDNDLSNAMIRQAALYTHYGMLAAQAQHQMDGADNRLEILKATVAGEARDRAASSGSKITEARIAELVLLDPRTQQAQKDLNAARMIYELARQACEAFKQRRDMLVQIGKRQLEEMEGQVRVMGANVPVDVKELSRRARAAAEA